MNSSNFYEKLEDFGSSTCEPQAKEYVPDRENIHGVITLRSLNKEKNHCKNRAHQSRDQANKAAWQALADLLEAEYLAAWNSPDFASERADQEGFEAACFNSSVSK